MIPRCPAVGGGQTLRASCFGPEGCGCFSLYCAPAARLSPELSLFSRLEHEPYRLWPLERASPDQYLLCLWQVAFHIQPYKGRDDITLHDNIKYIIDT